MTETPHTGPDQSQTPRNPDEQDLHDAEGPQAPHTPAAQQDPYARPDWRRPDAAQPVPPHGGLGDQPAGIRPEAATPGPGSPLGAGSQPGVGAQPGAAPESGVGSQPWVGPPAGAGASGPPPWPYATASDAGRTATAERPRRGGRQLVAVAAITAVLGGLIGGGAVAALDSGSTTVTSAGITRDASAAPTSTGASGTVAAAAAAATKSVVTLDVRTGSGEGTGSGVIIRADGYILTNEHVVAGAGANGSITVTFDDGRTAAATIVGTDPTTDLAVVKVSGVSGLTAATFADSDAVEVGQTVIAVGSPLGLDGTVTEGIVSAVHRPTRGSDDTAVIDAVQTDAAINSGNSGGPLVDLAGRVVGINTSIATAGSGSGPGQSGSSGNIGIGFAIPSNTAADIAEQLIADGTATHAYLGVQTGGTASSSSSDTGATLGSVESGGPAAAAGLQTGDVVTKVNDRLISDSDELVAAVRSHAPGEKVTLTIKRNGAARTVTVTLGSDDRK